MEFFLFEIMSKRSEIDHIIQSVRSVYSSGHFRNGQKTYNYKNASLNSKSSVLTLEVTCPNLDKDKSLFCF
jgi:hypothetical protein